MSQKFIIWTAALLLMLAVRTQGQTNFNLELVSNLNYSQNCNDIWAWVAPDGTEYAILGTTTGTAVINLADHSNPKEIQFIPGAISLWRDMKSWGDFVYVTTDQGADGLLVIDMSDAPESVSWEFWTPVLEANNSADTLKRCHNIYIDENGYAYLAGCNLNSGGPLILDVHTTPGEPIYIGGTDPRYSHDVYVRGDKVYSSDINNGFFSIIDVSDKTKPVTIATQQTSSRFTHNAWLSDNGKFLFTTDERPNAFIDAYDISDIENIFETDRYRPLSTEGSGVIPHNVHVKDDYLVISYYTDGVKVVDASDPYNMIEVGSYDTYPQPGGGFNGSWGAYPWLPSGLMLVSDINTGLYVFEPTYIRAARIEGVITDAASGALLNDVRVTILSDQTAYTISNASGIYRTGLGISGTYSVQFVKPGYDPVIIEADFENGVTLERNVSMQSEQRYKLEGMVRDQDTGAPLANVQLMLKGDPISYEAISKEDGSFELESVAGDYELIAGVWGYQYEVLSFNNFESNESVTVELEKGYTDHFVFDYGWVVTGDAPIGQWERGVPEATFVASIPSNPGNAFPQALGNQCYVTGPLAGSGPGDFDLDDGYTYLTTPEMDMSGYDRPILQYARWFYNGGGATPINDTMIVYLVTDDEQIVLERIWGRTDGWQLSPEFDLGSLIDISKPVQIVFEASDLPGTGHVVEAAVDFFSVRNDPTTSTANSTLNNTLKIFPNPTGSDHFYLQLSEPVFEGKLTLYNLNGQVVLQRDINQSDPMVQVTANSLQSGVYFVSLINGNGKQWTGKVIRE